MSVKSAHMHLAMNKPPRIDSAYAFAQKFRIAEQTAKECLRSNGYRYEEVTGGDNAWIRHSTQLDDIEAKLDAMFTMLHRMQAASGSPVGSLSEQLSSEKLDAIVPRRNGRGHGLAPTSYQGMTRSNG